MPQYRKKPVAVEARQFDGSNIADLHAWSNAHVWMWDSDKKIVHVATLEGVVKANEGDWIIKGTHGEFYPVRADIFAANYELA